jgi:hypothetical protein
MMKEYVKAVRHNDGRIRKAVRHNDERIRESCKA